MDDQSSEVAIKVEHVSKVFKLPHEKHNSIKSHVVNFYRKRKGYELQQALNDVSFEVKKGDFFGIVGRNGSGKSTMLKMLAGIYVPTDGSITTNGTIVPFIELGVGFNPELTGRENVFLNGALLGFNHKEMKEMYQDIVDFAELGKFMDQKLKNYSSGMQVRLAFSIAIRARGDILLLDEVLAVGDAAFQQKCFEYFDKLKVEKRTIIFVTHDMAAVKQFCDQAMLIHDGNIKQIGDPEKISQEYERINYSSATAADSQTNSDVKLRIYDKSGKSKEKFEFGEPIKFKVSWPKQKQAKIAGVVIYKGGEVVFATNTIDQNCDMKKNEATVKINQKLGEGRYKVSATIFGNNNRIVLGTSLMQNFLIYNQPFKGGHNDQWQGVVYLENEWN